MDVNKALKLKEELERRQKLKKEKKDRKEFVMKDYCFKAQYDFLRGQGERFRTAVCSRRAGKTVGIVADMYDTCLTEPNVNVLYLTVTKENARNIIWGDIVRLRDTYSIDCKLDNLRLTVTFPNGSRIMCSGAKDRAEIEKYRGFKLRKCYLDECQSFRSYIKDLVNDIITPALRDLRGDLFMTGTPSPVPVGYFFDCSHSKEWENFNWTAFDNPHMHDPDNGRDLEDTLAEERRLKGIDETDPSYIRETYGRWVEDLDSLVFKFQKARNVFTGTPKGEYSYVFGVDIGYNDSDAIAVLAYNNTEKVAYLVEESIKPKQGITELVEDIERLKKKYDPIKMVMDAGALGKKIQEEMRTRHSLSMDAAQKVRKVEFIELLNDDLRTEKLKAFPGSIFEEDCMLVQWDKESRVRNPEKPKISGVFHSDICDAVLYAWRECKHFHSELDKDEPKVNTDEYMEQLEMREAEAMENKKNNPLYELDKETQQDMDDLEYMLDWE